VLIRIGTVDLGSFPLPLALPYTQHDTIYADSQEGATALLRDTAAALAEVCTLWAPSLNLWVLFWHYRTWNISAMAFCYWRQIALRDSPSTILRALSCL